jgi:hypothetical protein
MMFYSCGTPSWSIRSQALRARHTGHINFHGFYPFHRPDLDGGLRDLRDPDTAGEEE